MNKCAKKVLGFIREHKLRTVNSENLIRAIKECGYEVRDYRPYSNEDNAQKLFEILNIKEFANGEDAFTYVDLENRIVFVSKTLSEKEKCIVLSHELGHICFKHMTSKKYIKGENIEQENEANEFSHYLLDGGIFFKLCKFINNYRERLIIAFIGMIVVLLVSGYMIDRLNSRKDDITYYITENGEKYHEEGCKHLDDKYDLKTGNREKFEKQGYTPCGDCLGNLS